MTKLTAINDDLQALLNVLPQEISASLSAKGHFEDLIEIVLDLGRLPRARYTGGEFVLLEREILQDELDYISNRISAFDGDNRAGLERTLHRISAMRNRRGRVVGLSCRVGRAVYGTTDLIEDLIQSGKSVLILGRPGIGKTTMLREAARILADDKRVIIVDSSNEIGGDGDVPHPAVGLARRMQVPKPNLQHEVMIEAVENHNPQVIVIDEIGRELEAQAARTIAERGVQLIGTAHGNGLENLMLNPTLSDLIGGIESVTLSDDEARRRGTQKTVLERRSPATFSILVEILERDRVNVYPDVAEAVDGLLRGHPVAPEERWRDEHGNVHRQTRALPPMAIRRTANTADQSMERSPFKRMLKPAPGDELGKRQSTVPSAQRQTAKAMTVFTPPEDGEIRRRIYPFGVARNRLLQGLKNTGLPGYVVDNIRDADLMVTQKRCYRERQPGIVQAEAQGMPIYVIKSNSSEQIEQFLADVFADLMPSPRISLSESAVDEARQAILRIEQGEEYVDLSPAPAPLRRIQHGMAEEAEISSQSYGKDPQRHVRFWKEDHVYQL